jgi:predicted methyltransferase
MIEPVSRPRRALLAAVGACLAFGASGALTAAPARAAAADPVLAAVLAGEWRSPGQRARDGVRRPAEVLAFWGLKPGATILELQPGEGWWTQILAPYAARTGGRYVGTGPDLENPAITPAARQMRADFEKKFGDRAIYGSVQLVNWGMTAAPLPENTYDFILVSRAIHGWARQDGMVERNFAQLARGLKPGGSLAIEAHRADPGPQDPKAANGYLTESWVIEQAAKAGLKLAAKSEINANPKDTKDHPFGVWTLPPTRTTVPYGSGKPADPTFDRTKYDAIGESDRMTLRFTKG